MQETETKEQTLLLSKLTETVDEFKRKIGSSKHLAQDALIFCENLLKNAQPNVMDKLFEEEKKENKELREEKKELEEENKKLEKQNELLEENLSEMECFEKEMNTLQETLYDLVVYTPDSILREKTESLLAKLSSSRSKEGLLFFQGRSIWHLL